MDKLTNNIRVKIDDKTRLLLESEAYTRRLSLSDIMREAIFEFIGSHNLWVKHSKVVTK